MQRCSKTLRDALEKHCVTTQIITVRLLKNKVRMCEIQQTKQAKQVWNIVSLLRRYMQLLLSITLLYLACSYVTLEIHRTLTQMLRNEEQCHLQCPISGKQLDQYFDSRTSTSTLLLGKAYLSPSLCAGMLSCNIVENYLLEFLMMY